VLYVRTPPLMRSSTAVRPSCITHACVALIVRSMSTPSSTRGSTAPVVVPKRRSAVLPASSDVPPRPAPWVASPPPSTCRLLCRNGAASCVYLRRSDTPVVAPKRCSAVLVLNTLRPPPRPPCTPRLADIVLQMSTRRLLCRNGAAPVRGDGGWFTLVGLPWRFRSLVLPMHFNSSISLPHLCPQRRHTCKPHISALPLPRFRLPSRPTFRLLGHPDPMPLCNCRTYGCVNANLHRSTYGGHQQKDRLALAHAELGLQSAQAAAPTHLTPLRPPTPSAPDEVFTAANEAGAAAPDDPEDQRAIAEARGQAYYADQAPLLNPLDDIGEEDEESDGEGINLPNPPIPPAHDQPPAPRSMPRDLPLHDAPTADPRRPGENDQDPRPLYMLYMLVSWLHTQCKLPFAACNVVLLVVINIALAAGTALGGDSHTAYVSLKSVLDNIGAEPVFQVLPVCPRCMEPYPASSTHDSTCDTCGDPLFKRIPRRTRRQPNAPDTFRPHLQQPYMGIETQLRGILAIPGMEDELEQWRRLERRPGTYRDMFDGQVPRNIKGPDERPFFENPVPDNSTELRIGLVLGLDW
jgi:hypothetical protein